MGILSWLSGRRSAAIDWSGVVVDITAFKCGKTRLGEAPDPEDPFAGQLGEKGQLRDEENGVEIGTEDGRLDYLFLSLDRFPGSLASSGRPLPLNGTSTERDVVAHLGDPYWRDEDDDEVLLFFEDGSTEVQCEFPGKAHLKKITMMRSPLLADPQQREAYGVDKPWPPR